MSDTNYNKTLIIIPCLNEAAHIGGLMDWLISDYGNNGAKIIIADGGSTDGTIEIVKDYEAKNDCIIYLHNPKKIQSAAINLAVETYGDEKDYFIRIDAHAEYPRDFCQKLLEEISVIDADSITVSMDTQGRGGFQNAVADAQNSKLGNGGSSHRLAAEGKYVDHGHHALFKIAAFKAVGGYDVSFSHNEDAELDYRLSQKGYKIWLSGKTSLIYFPRKDAQSLFKQYMNYGSGRAQNLLKHKQKIKLRQLLPIGVFPSSLLVFFSYISIIFLIPFLFWLFAIICYGILEAIKGKSSRMIKAIYPALIMHYAWSVGFWKKLVFNDKIKN